MPNTTPWAQVARKETARIMTFSGLYVNVLDLQPENILLEDIAHALSMQCRFAGHCKEFISIAQHSVNVSLHVPEEDALWGLLHDASEAYVTDIPRPLKHSSEMRGFCEIEERIQKVIARRFGLKWPMPPSVKEQDAIELLTEWESFKPLGGMKWNGTLSHLEPREDALTSYAPPQAKRIFLERFKTLTEAS